MACGWEDFERIDIDKIAFGQIDKVPERLFKYYKFDGNNYVKEIVEGKFHFTVPRFYCNNTDVYSSDDCECRVKYDRYKFVSAIRKLCGDKNETNETSEQRIEVNKYLKTVSDNYRGMLRVGCFCTELDNNHMWKNYASDGRGFCIEYDIKQFLLDRIGGGRNKNPEFYFGHVLYKHCDLVFDITNSLIQYAQKNCHKESLDPTDVKMASVPAFIKRRCYDKEKEYRLIFFKYIGKQVDGLDAEDNIDLSRYMKRIFLGPNISLHDEKNMAIVKVKICRMNADYTYDE